MGDLFVGRGSELDELRHALERARAGSGSFFLITGSAGIGKTRFASEIAAAAHHRTDSDAIGAPPFSIHWGHCWDSGAPPYWPWQRIARSLAASIDDDSPAGRAAAELSALLNQPPDRAAETSSQARFAFFDRCTELLASISSSQPLLILFDDLHWCDLPSLRLLQFVMRDVARMRSLVVATAREAETEIDDRRARAIGDLARWGRRVPLSGLSQAEAGELIQGEFHVRPAGPLLQRIHALTEGNPFFIDEVARLLRSRQLLQVADTDIEIPHEVRKVIGQRLELLPENARVLLQAAAVIGRGFEIDLLRAVSDVREADIVEALAVGERFHILARDRQSAGAWRFTHVLLCETLYEQLPGPRREALHRAVAETLEPTGGDAELAYHYLRAGNAAAAKAIASARRAGERALAAYAYETAGDHFTAALDRYEVSAVDDPELRCELLLGRGEAHARAMESAEARQSLLAAAELARDHRMHRHLARAALTLGTLELGVPRGRADEALVAVLEEALTAVGSDDPSLRARLLSRLAMELHYSPAVERRDALTTEAIELTRASGDDLALAQALSSRHFALWNVLSDQELITLAREVIARAERGGDLELELQGRTWAAIDELGAGEGTVIDHDLAAYAQRAEALRQPRYLGLAALFQGLRALWLGRFEEAHNHARRAMAAGERVGRPEAFGNAALLRIAILREQGQLEEADMAARFAVMRAPEVPVVQCLEAMMHAEMQRPQEARASLDRLAAAHQHNWTAGHWRSSLIGCLSPVCVYLGDTERAAWLYELALPHAGTHVAAGVNAHFGPYDYHLGTLADVLGRDADATRHFAAAIQLSRASGGLPYLARAQLAASRRLLESGAAVDRRQAAAWMDEALQHAEQIGMVLLATQLRNERERCGRPVAENSARAEGAEAVLQRDGEYWTVVYAGRVSRLRDSKGLRYLHELLQRPAQEVHVAQLAAITDAPPIAMLAGAVELGNGVTIRRNAEGRDTSDPFSPANRQRIGELGDRLEIARDLGDHERAAQLESELQQLAGHLSAAYSRNRGTADLVRQNVSRAIKSAIEKIGSHNPDLKLYLTATIKKGQFCCYQPDRRIAVRWKL